MNANPGQYYPEIGEWGTVTGWLTTAMSMVNNRYGVGWQRDMQIVHVQNVRQQAEVL